MSGIADTLKSIGQSIWEIPKGIINAIVELPNTILNGIKDIFIPDTDYVDTVFQDFISNLKTDFNFDTEFFENLFQEGEPVTDIHADYKIPGVGNFNLKLFDTKYLVQGVEYFRPFIRGFLVLLMGFYHVHMVLGFIRQDAGRVTGLGGKEET